MPRLVLRGGVAAVALAAALGLGATDASADMSIIGSVFKSQDKLAFEDVLKVTGVYTDVEVTLDADRIAGAEALADQENIVNAIAQRRSDTTDRMDGSVLGNRGVTSLNQAAGSMNNQGTALSVSTNGLSSHDSFADAQAALEQFNADNTAFVVGSDRRARVINSINSNAGITAVNQSAGNMANQANAIAVAVAPEFGVALSEADLGQWQLFNEVDEDIRHIRSTAQLSGSVQGNAGVTAVNQSSGNMANQSNVLSIAVAGTL